MSKYRNIHQPEAAQRSKTGNASGRFCNYSNQLSFRKGYNLFCAQTFTGYSPIATFYFFNHNPSYRAHIFAFDRYHGVCNFLNHLLLLLFVEDTFYYFYINKWHVNTSLSLCGEALFPDFAFI